MKEKISISIAPVLLKDLGKVMGKVLTISKTIDMLLEDLHARVFGSMEIDENIESHIEWITNYMISVKNRDKKDIAIREEEDEMTEQLTKKELKEFIKLKKGEGKVK